MTVELKRKWLPPEIAIEIATLIDDFSARHPDLISFHQEGTRWFLEESGGRKSLRASRDTDDGGVESTILVIDPEGGAGVHYIKVSGSSLYPDVDAHAHTAIVKATAFLKTI